MKPKDKDKLSVNIGFGRRFLTVRDEPASSAKSRLSSSRGRFDLNNSKNAAQAEEESSELKTSLTISS